MAGTMCNEDEEMMYCAGILLELPQLVYLSEFKDAWKQGNWNSTKKRSARKIRSSFADFNCRKSLMARFGSSCSDRCVSCVPSNKSAEKKRKRTNPNPNRINKEFKKHKPTPTPTATTSLKLKFKLSRPLSDRNTEKDSLSSGSGSGVSNQELLNAGGGDGTVAGKKRKKKNPSPDVLKKSSPELTPPAKKQKPSLKVTFKLSGRNRDTLTSSGSRVSNDELLRVAAGNAMNSSDNAAHSDAPSSSSSCLVLDEKLLIPDLNIPIVMTEEPRPQTQAKTQPSMLLQNNFVLSGLIPVAVPPSLHNRNIHHGYYISNDRAAAAKEKRMMRMQKLNQRKMIRC